MPRFMVTENHPEARFEDGVWKGPTKVPSPECYKLGERVLAKMKENAEIIAQIVPETGYNDSYGKMLDRTIRCALWLKKQGIKPGDVFSVCTNNHINSIIPILSSLMIGSVVNPWWHSISKDILKDFISITQPKILFVENTLAEFIQKTFQEENIDLKMVTFQKVDGFTSFDEILAVATTDEVETFQCTPVESFDTPALIMFSSGSTGGKPKGTLLSYGSLALTETEIPPAKKNDNVGLILSTVSWIVYVIYYLEVIKIGGTVIVGSLAGAEMAFSAVEKYKADWIIMNTNASCLLVNTPQICNHDFSRVKYVLYGGAAVTGMLMKKLADAFPNADILYCYGITEAGGRVTAQVGEKKPGSSGQVGLNTEVKVVGNDGETIQKPFEQGEIYMRTPCIMLEYYNNPKVTTISLDDDGWFRTGDIGYFDKDGDLYLVDRLKDMIKGIGIHMSPTAIENVIKEHPGVLNAAVVEKLHHLGSLEVPVAFVVKKPGANVSEKELIDLMAQQNSPLFNLEGGVRFLDSLPTTESGKIQRTKLRQLALLD